MCGRYVSPDRAAIERAWQIGRATSNPFRQRYNVLPTTLVPVLRAAPGGGLALDEARWGLVPAWWKEAKPPQATFNARSEDAAGKPIWREPYRRARCLLPAVGWYEWQAVESVDEATGEIRRFRQPYFIYPADRRLACFAGLLSARGAPGGAEQLSCALLTRAAAGRAAEIHDRMPVVLPEAAFGRWLAPEVVRPEDVAALIAAARADFEHYPVSTRLNAAKTDDAALIDPLP
ncbi:MAG: SOS response-associated peptidase [Betaproteobacteria bacterium]|nr:SOS response-associated peptidase [Betaproteobacteria bacterium]